MRTLGVAGHVDHGKTALVHALTGQQTDKLPEERRRGISIEPGFAFLDLPTPGGTERVALVDMPGHERFVRRMIAGAQGLGGLLLVVAADAGLMPQAREHLAIAAQLGVQRGFVALSKSDLADPDWLVLVQAELRQQLAQTFLADAPIVPVSVRQPEQLAIFANALQEWLRASPLPVAAATLPFVLAVDRSLSVPGHGTIVTGMALQGAPRVGDELELLPQGLRVRVRGLQQHNVPVGEPDLPGRLAVQLAAVSVAEAPAGSWLVTPGSVAVVDRADVVCHLLPHAPPLGPRSEVQVHVGTSVVMATAVQLTAQPQQPGSSALVQLHFAAPVALPPRCKLVLRGFVRDPQWGWTLGGAEVLWPGPPRHRLGQPDVLNRLGQLWRGTDAELLLAWVALQGWSGADPSHLSWLLPWTETRIQRAEKAVLASGKVRWAGPRLLTPEALLGLGQRLLVTLQAFHQRQPTAAGLTVLALTQQAAEWLHKGVVAAVAATLVRAGQLQERPAGTDGNVLALPGFVPQQVDDPQSLALLYDALAMGGLAPRTPAVLADALAKPQAVVLQILEALVRSQRVVRLADDVYVVGPALQQGLAQVLGHWPAGATIATAELKELLGLTRKHLIPFAEYLDAGRWTLRLPSGDRVLRRQVHERFAGQTVADEADSGP
jgi:selenocysteine-specific elongation factor